MTGAEPAAPEGGCCSPSRPPDPSRPSDDGPTGPGGGQPPVRATGDPGRTDGLVAVPGGTFLMGTDAADGFPADREGPVRPVTLEAFHIDPLAVSVERFARFVAATGYRTSAEEFGWSFVFAGLLPEDFEDTAAVAQAPWWRQVFGADWAHPEGPHSDVVARADHPVVHVSWLDAQAYCTWSGTRLPSEAEWERAARGGLEQARYPWGDELVVDGEHRCNIWQGEFPVRNTLDDGYLGTAPVDSYPPNGLGLHNLAGNVWEWCEDWFDPDGRRDTRAIRGGSYLCHQSYCNRYRVAARSANTPDSSTGNMGFRVAR
jgi:formylglycine-generating enzyme